MKLTVLMENSTPSGRFAARHGLSLFIEANGKRVLFDMGPDAAFLENAKAAGVDVMQADAAVVSHGHSDHGGGLKAYLDLTSGTQDSSPATCTNTTVSPASDQTAISGSNLAANTAVPAPVYIHEAAFGEFAAGSAQHHHDIGLDPKLAENPRIVKTNEPQEILPGMLLFSGVGSEHPLPASNKVLLMHDADGFAPDDFRHEQNLLVTDGDRRILVSGCSHRGILNIMDRAERLAGAPLDVVVGGFHLMDPGSGKVQDGAETLELANELAHRGARYYTFHCTGLAAYSQLRDTLGDRIDYLYAGSTVEL